ncbi:hypothetical protein [Actinotalea ferrariae]|uniref:hypothetical protein n=1 Tax=Actinotalea ferrariae TaxID=1386098 RepID=UPI0012DC7F2E|nr:hypothetical protein [Actinotalea ferrariae]
MYDAFAHEGERTWTDAETRELLRRYLAEERIAQIAIGMSVDAKDVAARLTRLLLGASGPIANEHDAPRSGHGYTEDDRARIAAACRAGRPIKEIAAEHGRTQLAVGWQLLDGHVPTVPAHLRP